MPVQVDWNGGGSHSRKGHGSASNLGCCCDCWGNGNVYGFTVALQFSVVITINTLGDT